jgi:type III secretory pathway component EscU
MLTIAVVIIAIIMILANFELILALAVLAGILAIGLAVLAAVIAIILTWPWIVVGIICFSIALYLLTAWDVNREAKRQTK